MKKKKNMMMMMFFENVKHSECLSSLSLLARSRVAMLTQCSREKETGEPHLPLLRGILFTPGRGLQGE